ncbi:MAG: hypothetical protein QOK17_199 [Sphingomonadales bacterium]|jgi:hypothetical protein|nr:hypothetical protein [Sphingomonadales bacterium]
MDRPPIFILSALALGASAAAAPETIGIFSTWGAFRDGRGCRAVAEPDGAARSGAERPFASVSFVPSRGVRGQIAIRFGRTKRPGSAILLRVDERTFQLIGGSADAWAPDARADAAIVAAMRTGVAMSVETRSDTGGTMRDLYRLRGAATAIDAAAIACAR